MKKIAIFTIIFATSTLSAHAQLFDIWNNDKVNKVIPNCYMRPEENIITKKITYNEVCDPVYYIASTNSGGSSNYNTQPTFTQSLFSYPQQVISSIGNYMSGIVSNNNNTNSASSFYTSGSYPTYYDNGSYYQTTNTYTPTIVSDHGNHGGDSEYPWYSNTNNRNYYYNNSVGNNSYYDTYNYGNDYSWGAGDSGYFGDYANTYSEPVYQNLQNTGCFIDVNGYEACY